MDREMIYSKVHQWTFIGGLGVLVLSYLLRFEGGIGALHPMGIATLVICPILGIVGLGFSIRNRSLLFGLLNLAQVFSFFIVMALASGH